MKDIIFLIDFDKTIALKDSTDELMRMYDEKLLKEYQTMFRQGKLRVRDYLKGLVESLDISKEEYSRNIAKNIELDPYFKEFLELNYEIRVVSAGAYENILPIFEKKKIEIPLEHIYSNKINFTDNGIKVTFPHDIDEASDGICKSFIIKKYKEEYKTVIFIGDGSSDIACARYADILFAKKGYKLEKYCDENKIVHFKYENFQEIINKLETLNLSF